MTPYPSNLRALLVRAREHTNRLDQQRAQAVARAKKELESKYNLTSLSDEARSMIEKGVEELLRSTLMPRTFTSVKRSAKCEARRRARHRRKQRQVERRTAAAIEVGSKEVDMMLTVLEIDEVVDAEALFPGQWEAADQQDHEEGPPPQSSMELRVEATYSFTASTASLNIDASDVSSQASDIDTVSIAASTHTFVSVASPNVVLKGSPNLSSEEYQWELLVLKNMLKEKTGWDEEELQWQLDLIWTKAAVQEIKEEAEQSCKSKLEELLDVMGLDM